MGREQGLRGFPGKLHPVMESPLDQRLQGDQDCDRTQQDPCLAQVAEADWTPLPAHQKEKVKQRNSLPRGRS